ncbi:MAG: hypothetical protein Q7U51_01500, partial [Methanoregula sp.]|nr:hypothetical protein [Methanoregula sp.]
RLIMIKDGQVVGDGTPREVLTSEKIRVVYGADVITSVHPATGRTFLMPLATTNGRITPDKSPYVLVISGGGSGTDLLHFLSHKGFSLTTGILATTDTDYLTAKALEISCVPIPPFSHIPAHSLEKLRGLFPEADRIILSMHPMGTGNLPVLAVLRETDPARIIIHLPEGRDFPSYDFTKGDAAAVLSDLCAAGAQCTGNFNGILKLLNKTFSR